MTCHYVGRSRANSVREYGRRILGLNPLPDLFLIVGLVGEYEAVPQQLIIEQRPGQGAVVGLNYLAMTHSWPPIDNRQSCRFSVHYNLNFSDN